MVRGDKQDLDELVRLLKLFNEALVLDINLEKLCAYWFDKYTHTFKWLVGYNWRSAEVGDLSKLLVIPFGLHLNAPDVNQLLFKKIYKKLDCWSNMKLFLAWRVAIYNRVMMSIF